MKEIFDWLREQIRNREKTADFRIKEFLKTKEADGFEIQAGKQMAFLETLTLINEAEAKWKSCCQWKHDFEGDYYEPSCSCFQFTIGGVAGVNAYKFCPFCSRRIKIVEVE